MSIEQMIVLALVIVLPLLEALARVRQTRASPSQNDAGGHAVAAPPPARPRSPLPNRTVKSRGMRAAQKVAMPATPLLPLPRRASDHALSPAVRNLRRAIVVATILGPPVQ